MLTVLKLKNCPIATLLTDRRSETLNNEDFRYMGKLIEDNKRLTKENTNLEKEVKILTRILKRFDRGLTAKN